MDIDDELESKGTGCIVATKGSFLTVLETHKNIAPIIDAVLVNIDNIGQVCTIFATLVWFLINSLKRQILTCSGGKNTGSVNVVRHGADVEELAYIPSLTNVSNVWPVKLMFRDM